MPRPGREDYEGAWQHVMNRGIDRGTVFRSDDDRAIFLDCLAVTTARFGLQAHAYVCSTITFICFCSVRAGAFQTGCVS